MHGMQRHDSVHKKYTCLYYIACPGCFAYKSFINIYIVAYIQYVYLDDLHNITPTVIITIMIQSISVQQVANLDAKSSKCAP
jgi:hypothetical protein